MFGWVKRGVYLLLVMAMILSWTPAMAMAAETDDISDTALAITQQPEDVCVAAGEKATVTFTAQGEGLTYKWYYKNKGVAGWYLTTAFTGNSYAVTMNESRDGRMLYCVVKDKYGNTLQTKTVTLTLAGANAVTITQQPEDVSVAAGESATVSFTAEGEGLSYKWYYKNKGVKGWYLTTTFTGNTYSVTMDDTRNGRQIYCVVKDKYGNTVQTNTVTLTQKAATALSITQEPTDISVPNGEMATVSFTAEGEGLTYKWYFKNKGVKGWYLTTAFTGNTYAVAMNESRDGRQIYCVVKDKYGNTVQTKTVTISMMAEENVPAKPEDEDIEIPI